MTTFISNQGEIFEGTKNELMKEKGIKHKTGFSRPSGAVDADGDRWLVEEQHDVSGFILPPLYLFPRISYVYNKHTDKVDAIREAASETADVYLLLQEIVDGDPDHPEAANCVKGMKSIEAKFQVIGEAQDTKLQKELVIAQRENRDCSDLRRQISEIDKNNRFAAEQAHIHSQMLAKGMTIPA